MAAIQSAAAEIRRGKKERTKNKLQHENIMVCPIPCLPYSIGQTIMANHSKNIMACPITQGGHNKGKQHKKTV